MAWIFQVAAAQIVHREVQSLSGGGVEQGGCGAGTRVGVMVGEVSIEVAGNVGSAGVADAPQCADDVPEPG